MPTAVGKEEDFEWFKLKVDNFHGDGGGMGETVFSVLKRFLLKISM